MATISNLYIDQGSDFYSIITITDQAGAAMDLTGYTIKSQFRKSYNSSSYTEFEAGLISPTTGEIYLRLDADISSSVSAGRYLYDVEITSSAGNRIRALEGIVLITPEITR